MTDYSKLYDDRVESVGLTRRDQWPDKDGWICNCIVIRQGKVLLLRRAEDGFLGGQWDIPGGKLDEGEQPEVAAARELFEEAGLHAASVQELAHYSSLDNKGGDYRFHIVTYRVVEADDTAPVRLSDEHPDFRWASKDELKKLKVVWYVERALQHCDW